MNTLKLRMSTALLLFSLVAGAFGSMAYVNGYLIGQTQSSAIDIQLLAGDHESGSSGG